MRRHLMDLREEFNSSRMRPSHFDASESGYVAQWEESEFRHDDCESGELGHHGMETCLALEECNEKGLEREQYACEAG